MNATRKTLIAGNWKMNGLRADAIALASSIVEGAKDLDCQLLICPPYTLLHTLADVLKGSNVMLGAQDTDIADFGAHTGDICSAMLKDAGCTHVIVGHSERRSDHGESDAFVYAKAEVVHAAGLTAVICIGETDLEREQGLTMASMSTQLDGSVPKGATAENTVIAYEPVWAIGTGKTATPDDAQDVHDHIRTYLATKLGHQTAAEMRIIYGGSMKPGNAAELLAQADIDGGLIGGAALKAEDFLGIAKAKL